MRKPDLTLTVQYATARRGVPHRRSLERWVAAALERSGDITVRFVGTREGRSLNAQFRGKPAATNVLSFTYDGHRNVRGDIVICPQVVRGEAREQSKPSAAHFAHMVVHGVLHLQGYDHERPRAAREMEARERATLASLGYPDPYMPRSRRVDRGAAS